MKNTHQRISLNDENGKGILKDRQKSIHLYTSTCEIAIIVLYKTLAREIKNSPLTVKNSAMFRRQSVFRKPFFHIILGETCLRHLDKSKFKQKRAQQKWEAKVFGDCILFDVQEKKGQKMLKFAFF